MIDEKKLIECIRANGILGSGHSDTERENDVISMIESQQKIGEWTPYTEENKPEKEGFYLITVELIVLGESELLVKKEWFSEKMGCFSGYDSVTLAWMPLPEPYKEK